MEGYKEKDHEKLFKNHHHCQENRENILKTETTTVMIFKGTNQFFKCTVKVKNISVKGQKETATLTTSWSITEML